MSNITLSPKDAKFDFKGAYTEDSENINLYMMRQGVSETINCAHPLFFVEIEKYPDNGYSAEVHYSNDASIHKNGNHGQIYKAEYKISKGEAFAFVSRYASNLAGKTVTIDPQVLGYCYGWNPYDYQNSDKFLSPAFYCEYSDTVRHSVTNVCLVAFKNGEFSSPDLDMDKAATEYRPHLEKALSVGFHECDTKKGDDHCKRRLAWLAGAYMAKAGSSARFCNLDMSLVKSWGAS